MNKKELAYLKIHKKPIAELKPDEQILGGDWKYINPKWKGRKKIKPEKEEKEKE